MAEPRSTVIPALRYRDAPAAIEWLCNVLGFTRHAVYEGAGGVINHVELSLGGGMIMLGSMKESEKGKENEKAKEDEQARRFKAPAELGGAETSSVYIVVPDADAVYARAQAAGATIVRPLQQMEYGSREFTVSDPEGHSWSVGTYNPWSAQS
ncbi:MAG: VOC family protein [Terracidiphilus sp.]